MFVSVEVCFHNDLRKLSKPVVGGRGFSPTQLNSACISTETGKPEREAEAEKSCGGLRIVRSTGLDYKSTSDREFSPPRCSQVARRAWKPSVLGSTSIP